MAEIAQLLAGNANYAAARANVADPRPSLHLAVVTCMDARIDVFAVLGLHLGAIGVTGDPSEGRVERRDVPAAIALVLSGTASLATPPDATELPDQLTEAATDAVYPGDAAVVQPHDDVADAAEGDAPEGGAPEGDVAESAEAEVPGQVEGAEEDAAADGGEATAAATEDEDGTSAEISSEVSPLFVPPGDPGPGEAKIIIGAGGDRTGTGPTSTEVAPLEGATFELFRTDAPDNLTGGTPTGQSCTTDASGQCGVFVELTSGTNYFYAVQTAAPAGWIIPTAWAAGTAYRFSTRPGIESSGTVAERTRLLPMQIAGTAPDPGRGPAHRVHGILGPPLPSGGAPSTGLATGHALHGVWIEH